MSALSASIIAACARALAGPSARWINCRPSTRQRVYFANHTSHLDFVVLWSVLPKRVRALTRPVAAKDYWDSGLRKRIAVNAFNAVLVERNRVDRTHNPLVPMLEALDEGYSLLVFPEGTRGNGQTVQPFKCGVYHLAQARPHVELVPVWIDNLHRVLPKGAVLPAPLLCSVTFGEPTRFAPGEGKKEFLGRLHRMVTGLGESCATNCY